MMLITKAIAKKLPAYGATAEMSAEEIKVPLKLFNPCGAATWYITEMDPETGLMFGWCDLGFGWTELGPMSLNAMQAGKLPFDLTIERDMWWDEKTTLDEVMEGS